MARSTTSPVYRHKAWRQVRPVVLERDGYRCQIKDKRCTGRATEVDHIVPFADGGALYDPDNLRAACKACNVGRAAKAKASDGWRRSPTRIVLVVGPPAGGKSTFVDTHKSPGDVVVDFDRMAEAMGSSDTHTHSAGNVEATQAARNAVLTRLRRGDLSGARRAWIVSANPKAESMFPHHDLEVCDPGPEETHARATRAGRPGQWHQLIDSWYAARVPTVPGGSRRW